MKRCALLLLLFSPICGFAAPAGSPAPDTAALTQLLNEFLDGASRNDVAIHERFWADEVIYTRSAGQRIGKSDLLRAVKEDAAAPKKPDAETTKFSAEDVRILQYGETAVVAFRLVGTTSKEGKTEVSKYLNTGTFVKRDGKWQVVAWQATKKAADDLPAAIADARKTIQADTDLIQKASAGKGALATLLSNQEFANDLKALIANLRSHGVLFYRDNAAKEEERAKTERPQNPPRKSRP
jgi:hypothetical protein